MARNLTEAASKNSKVLFENEKVRVVEIKWKKGLKIPMHSHPAYFTYGITALKYKSTSPDGKMTRRSMKKGELRWYEAESHTIESVGETGSALIVELK